MDKGYAWVVMMASFGANVVISGLILTTGIMLVTLQERFFQDDITKTVLVTSLYTSLSSLAGPLGSFIIQRTSCRVALVIGSLAMASGFLGTSFSKNLNVCIFSCGIIAGIGSGISCSVLFIVNGFHFKKKLNIANGVSFSGGGVGLFTMAPLFERAKEIYGYPGVFMLAATASLQLSIFGVLMRPSTLERRSKLDKEGNDPQQTPKEDKSKYLKLFHDKATFLLVVSFGFYMGGKDSSFMYWPSLLKENLFSTSQASVFLSISGICAIIGRLVIGYISSRDCVDIFYVYCFSLFTSGIPCICFKIYASSTVGQIINAVFIGIFMGTPLVTFTACTIRCVGVKYLPAVGGMQMLSGGIGSIVIPLICGHAVSKGWEYVDALLICGSCLIVSAVFVLVLKFTRKKLVEEDNVCSSPKQSVIFNVMNTIMWGK